MMRNRGKSKFRLPTTSQGVCGWLGNPGSARGVGAWQAMRRGMTRRIVNASGSAAFFVLWGLLVPAAAGTARLTLRLPERAVTIPLSSHAGSLHLPVESLARALAATVQKKAASAIALHWEGRGVRFAANHREVTTSAGTAMLSAPALRLGSALWLPPDGAAIAARERFGADRVRWDPKTRTLTVAGSPSEIRAMRVGSHPDRIRLVLEAAAPVDWSVLAEGDGGLVIALPGSALSPTIVRREYHGGLLRAVEPVPGPRGAQVRVTFAGRADQARWFTLPDPFRIVVDLHRAAPSPARAADGVGPHPTTRAADASAAGQDGGREGGQATAAGMSTGADPARAAGPPRAHVAARPQAQPPAAAPATPPDGDGPSPAKGSSPSPPAPEAPPQPGPGAPLTIVIDPGHGGKDTGAIGPRGLREKDVVLDIGLRLHRLLTERLGARVIMTRPDDTFVPLEERTAIANRAHADFFISIHVNAAPQARASGVETYYLSREPSDISARASAARENLVLNLEGVSPREQDSLKAVLWDMAESLHMQESSVMAEMLLEGLGRGLRVETRGVKHGPFVVLMTAGMPSALVEVAFISNPSQERRLQEGSSRHSIAIALSEGIERFAHRYQRRIGMQPPRPGPS